MPDADTGETRLAGTAARRKRRRVAIVVVAALACIALAGFGTLHALQRTTASAPVATSRRAPGLMTGQVATSSADASSVVAEVPNVVGLGLDEASIVLRAVGLTIRATQTGAVAVGKPTVSSQDPAAGTLARIGSVVRVGVPVLVGGSSQVTDKSPRRSTGFVVCIDPGHQAHSDASLEPLGPGSKEMKPAVSGGATGVSTGIPEYEIALQIATNLQDRLEAAGVKVVMTRTTNDVDISNSARAAIANDAHADLFVRVHADSNTDPAVCGISTLYPASNAWTSPIFSDSQRAAKIMQASVVRATRGADDGAVERSDLSGFNWSKVPSVLVETGFLSNTVEDRLLASPRYQDEVASGMADGILAYLRSQGR